MVLDTIAVNFSTGMLEKSLDNKLKNVSGKIQTTKTVSGQIQFLYNRHPETFLVFSAFFTFRYSKRIARFGTHTSIDGRELETPEIRELPRPPPVFNQHNHEVYTVAKFKQFGLLKPPHSAEFVSKLTGIPAARIRKIEKEPIEFTCDEFKENGEEDKMEIRESFSKKGKMIEKVVQISANARDFCDEKQMIEKVFKARENLLKSTTGKMFNSSLEMTFSGPKKLSKKSKKFSKKSKKASKKSTKVAKKSKKFSKNSKKLSDQEEGFLVDKKWLRDFQKVQQNSKVITKESVVCSSNEHRNTIDGFSVNGKQYLVFKKHMKVTCWKCTLDWVRWILHL